MRGQLCGAMAVGLSAGVGIGIGGWPGSLVVICILASFVLGMIAMFDE